MTDHAALIRRSLAPGADAEFDRRVARQGEALAAAVAAGRFDNDAITLGLELETYAVTETDAGLRLAELPGEVFEGPAAKELGLHNAELNADPSTLSDDGIAAQARAIEADLRDTRERARDHDCEIVLDAMWAVPPEEGTVAYLDDVEERTVDDVEERTVDGTDDDTGSTDGGRDSESTDGGRDSESTDGGPDSESTDGGPDTIYVARNMRQDPRYGALDNEAVHRAGGSIQFSVPGADLSFRTILFESLATSIQPHVQVPDAADFPRYHNLATRTLGPLLALSTNSPFLPADCYDVDDPRTLVDETHHELRIAAFEQSMNQGCRKVRVPRDLDAPSDVVDHVVADDTYGPFLREWIDGDAPPPGVLPDGGGAASGAEGGDGDADELLDHCWEFDYKRSTFWRWVRGVPGGTAVEGACDERSLRIEYRPLPTQPTVRDVVGLQVLTAGLLHGLVVTDHPLDELPWAAAEQGFYSAVREGLGADLRWVTADGDRTTDHEVIYDELFGLARRGLADQGVSRAVQDRYLDPLARRVETGLTPSRWKQARVRQALDDGADLAAALEAMQVDYVAMSRQTDSFAEWI